MLLPLLLLAAGARAATVAYDWQVTWVNAAPDGFARPVIGINGAWPCPTIEASVGDTVRVTLTNGLGNETTGLHFHGIDQIDTPWMDGPSGVTQCPVPPGRSITYEFVANAPGTYWYHSHNMGQYPDGLRGPLIVHDPDDPYKGAYDEEVVLTVSDWYHSQTPALVQAMLTPNNTQFLPPFPDGILLNEGAGANISFAGNKTYRLRIISFAAFAATMLHFDAHTLRVIMADATYVQAASAYQLRVSPAQRYDVLVSGSARDHRNYPILAALDVNRDYAHDPANAQAWPHNATGYLVMDPKAAFAAPESVAMWQPLDDVASLAAYDGAGALAGVTDTVVLDFTFCTDANGYPRACFNNQTYVGQAVPTLYSAASLGDAATNASLYGAVNAVVLGPGAVVDLVVNNRDNAIHPFHLHGHQFQVLARPAAGTGRWPGRARTYAAAPLRRDTVHVNPDSYALLRFRADHAGVFLFHCHIEWHVEMGLTATLIQSPAALQGAAIPADHLANCAALGIPTAGNAAGRTGDDVYDTSGFATVPPTSYTGALYAPTAAPRLRERMVRKHL